ncbi:MAG TPA: ornithine cyclodeaminase family protein [Thermoanaerobaculia bacterium]|jgi:ornithine cyclodeaminase/alanine dehydrogenase-like protein (mu-crystallin family)|nr:ornithine cyclodeaminase family protein [Thermoanaerobaculia bacterium]
MTTAPTLLLSRDDVAASLTLDACIAVVENAFRMAGRGESPASGILGYPTGPGGFHVKAAALRLSHDYFAAKLNANFSENRARFGLPTIQGVVALFDAENGRLLALMDSIEITLLRTAAATAVAAKHLARADSEAVLVGGCGAQARAQLRALARVLPIKRVLAYDTDAPVAERFARDLAPALGIEIATAPDPGVALRCSDVAVTCTTSRRAFLRREDVPPGLFIAAVGADAPEKQELDPEILRTCRLVVDSRDQCATIGELHHALEQGILGSPAEATELAEVVVGKKPGRQSREEIVVFDSTGIALEDVAAAAAAYEDASRAGRGQTWDPSESTRPTKGGDYSRLLLDPGLT